VEGGKSERARARERETERERERERERETVCMFGVYAFVDMDIRERAPDTH